MIEKQLEQLTIVELENAEYEDAELKNRCLLQTKTPYIAYVLHSAVEEAELLEMLARQEKDVFAVFTLGGRTADLDYTGVFELVSVPVVAVLFPKTLIRKTGAFNQKLSAETNFELICRMVRETNQCAVVGIGESKGIAAGQGKAQAGELTACSLAYMVRQHLNSLHALGVTDQIFALFCEYARSNGFFEIFQEKVNRFLSDEREYEGFARQTAPFVVLRGDDTCGGVLQGFADDLADGLAESGQAVILMDDNFTQHEKLQNMVCKGVVGFQSKALEIDFFRQMRGPKFQFWFDNPLRFEGVLRNLPEEYYILCQDANYAALIRDYYHTQNAIQFPPGGQSASCDGKGNKPQVT